MNKGLAIQRYLRSGKSLEDLKEEFAVKSKAHAFFPNLFSLKYNQLESPMGERLVQECRGLILDADDNWKVIARSFDKFFNHGEGHAATIDWKSAEVFKKLDGSLIIMYYYRDEWHVATSGMADAGGMLDICQKTFAQLFWEAFEAQGLERPPTLSKSLTFMWELTSQYNRIVVQHKAPSVTLLGVRDRRDGMDTSIDVWAGIYPIAESFPLSDVEAITATFEDMDPLSQEGYVVRDAGGNRIKMKSPAYVAIHHLKEGVGWRRFVEIARSGETSEFLTYFPEYVEEYTKYKDMVDGLIVELTDLYSQYSAIENQKEFALAVKSCQAKACLFQKRRADQNGESLSFSQIIARMNIKPLARMLNIK